ncbi:MAG: hypothetical protein GF418_14830 [Chitinivibrionales bacterium]|nr:hypothetical protein [Chitinivibrionales bacterium]MBD3396895.1 hypothetical protein [Chitinivibrionales bacterium]
MTTVTFVTKKCRVCGNISRQAEMGVRGIMEPYDLDSRPTGAARSSIYLWVQRCSACGYCAPDITQGDEGVQKVVKSQEYRNRLTDQSRPEALNHFLCWSMLQEAVGRHNEAGWAMLYAAWICDDDANIRAHAVECRENALHLFDKARECGQDFRKGRLQEELLKIDLFRRCGRFDEAAALCSEQLERGCDSRSKQILLFQEDLLEAKDSSKHTIAEATEDM